MNFTTKQLAIMFNITAGNGLDETGKFIPIDMDQLLERLDYKPSKQSLQFSLRALIKHKMIIKAGSINRRGRRRVIYLATELGRTMMKPPELAKTITETLPSPGDIFDTAATPVTEVFDTPEIIEP